MKNAGIAQVIEEEIRKMSNIEMRGDYERDGTNKYYDFEIKACRYKVKSGIAVRLDGSPYQQTRSGTFAIHKTQHEAMSINTLYIFAVYAEEPEDILFTLIVHKDIISSLLGESETTRLGWRKLFKEVSEWNI